MGKMCSCGGCQTFTKHYAKGLCRNCYSTMLRCGFTDVKQLAAYKKGKREHSNEIKERKILKAERISNLKVTTCNEFTRSPRGEISRKIFDWYYGNTDKYLIFDCGNDDDLRTKVYNTAYAMTKRRHKLDIKRYRDNGRVILEKTSA